MYMSNEASQKWKQKDWGNLKYYEIFEIFKFLAFHELGLSTKTKSEIRSRYHPENPLALHSGTPGNDRYNQKDGSGASLRAKSSGNPSARGCFGNMKKVMDFFSEKNTPDFTPPKKMVAFIIPNYDKSHVWWQNFSGGFKTS